MFVGGPPVPHGVGEACELVICDGVGAKKVGEGKRVVVGVVVGIVGP